MKISQRTTGLGLIAAGLIMGHIGIDLESALILTFSFIATAGGIGQLWECGKPKHYMNYRGK
jgi:hypothetical protein